MQAQGDELPYAERKHRMCARITVQSQEDAVLEPWSPEVVFEKKPARDMAFVTVEITGN
jgi:hypothetical protein